MAGVFLRGLSIEDLTRMCERDNVDPDWSTKRCTSASSWQPRTIVKLLRVRTVAISAVKISFDDIAFPTASVTFV